MGENKWSSQRKAARSAKRRQAQTHERVYLSDPEESERNAFDGEKYKSNKRV